MPKIEPKAHPLIGTASYDNWRAFIDGEPQIEEYEHLLYSDARLSGEVSTGLEPYGFLNLVPLIEEPGTVRAVFVIRWSCHVVFDLPNFDKTDASRYHGGGMIDEIAALASLKCGVRFRAGGLARRFEVRGDPKGRPVAWGPCPEPSMAIGNRRLVLPTVTGEHSIMGVEQLKSFPSLRPKQAIALVRSARLYQDALWLAESEPNLSWLMLVGAVETAANIWSRSADSSLDRLKEDSRPALVEYLNATGIDGLADRVAKEFADVIGVGKKFREFLLTYLPEPPPERPPNYVQVDWSTDSLAQAFRNIYHYRSKALHDGMPFPAPMCQPPVKYESAWEAPEERPHGMSVSGGTWLPDDLPMRLHIFEYITRHALNAWWSAMAAQCVHAEKDV
jgi:hypothetical protein